MRRRLRLVAAPAGMQGLHALRSNAKGWHHAAACARRTARSVLFRAGALRRQASPGFPGGPSLAFARGRRSPCEPSVT